MSDKLATSAFINLTGNIFSANPWSSADVDRMEAMSVDEYREVIKACRFFYRRDSIVSTVVNKLVDISMSGLKFDSSKLSNNETRILESLIPKLEEYAENIALEYLISGLVVPEIKMASVGKNVLKEFGIKKYDTLVLPVSMWIRDPATVKINSSMVMDEPSFYVIVPDKLIFFIMHDGTYPDGNQDLELFAQLKAYYPEFVTQIRSGAREVLIDNPLIVRRRPLSDSPYPTPFLYPAIEHLKHKRNLRRMDYSIASRVISAIQLFKLGSDEFPVTEDQQEQFDSIREQMTWRNTGGRDIERIFQLFANHTLKIEWIFPPVDALLNDKKYAEVNQDIIFSLGFPQILITGETTRSNSSDPEFATLSPIKTMENLRAKVLSILNKIVFMVMEDNRLKGETHLQFKPINLRNFSDFITSLSKLYDTGNLSRTSYADEFGYNFEEEAKARAEEKKLMESLGIDEFSAQPFSPQPNNQNGEEQSKEEEKKEPVDNTDEEEKEED